MAALHAGGSQLVATAFSRRRPSRRGKGGGLCDLPFTVHFGSTLFVRSDCPIAKHCSSLGARTGARTAKLRAHDPRAKILMIHWRGAFGVWRAMDPIVVDPLAVERSPRDRRPAHRQWCHQWHAFGPCISSWSLANGTSNGMQSLCVQTVLQCAPPCAHQRRSIGIAIG